MYAPITHILAGTSFRRERLLPMSGRVLARRGQLVSPVDVVAEAVLTPEHMLLDIARGLSMSAKQADKLLQCKAGDEVGEGDILAGRLGMGRRVVRAPSPGRVMVAGEGQVLLQLDGQPQELKAGYPGLVVDLIGERGVIIETTGALIQGVWGNGRINYGLLSIQALAPDALLAAEQLDVSLRGTVIFGGICADERVLLTAEELPVRGMILASLDSALVPLALRLSYPIVLIEGFGRLPLNPQAFKLFASSERRETAINAEPWNRLAGTRPEIVLAAPSQSIHQPPLESTSFSPGQTVRMINRPYQGQLGMLAALHPGLTRMPSGISAPAADVRLENGEIVLIPLANLEILN
jgi:hypothetical protein